MKPNPSFKFRHWIIIVSIIFLLCGCSSPQEEIIISEEKEEESEIIQPSREAVYVYNQQPENNSKQITLKLNNEPLLMPEGSMRLLGVVVGGRRKQVLLEVAGEGRFFSEGDNIQGYQLIQISESKITLRKE